MLYVVCFVIFVSIIIATVISIHRLKNIKDKSSVTPHESMYQKTNSADSSDISFVEQSLAQKKIRMGELPDWNELTELDIKFNELRV